LGWFSSGALTENPGETQHCKWSGDTIELVMTGFVHTERCEGWWWEGCTETNQIQCQLLWESCGH